MEEQLHIIVDQRERVEELIDGLKTRGLSIDIETVPIGDYIISDRVCIERKTISDFEGSIINGRLFDQLQRLKENYELPILILEGDQDTFRLQRKVINGTVVSVYIDYGVPILFSTDPENTAEIISVITKREQSGGKREPSVKGGARAYSNEQFQEFIIGNLPGIGAKLARSLLKHFGSVKAIANADIEELMDVEKIGKKKAALIHRTLNHEYSPKED